MKKTPSKIPQVFDGVELRVSGDSERPDLASPALELQLGISLRVLVLKHKATQKVDRFIGGQQIGVRSELELCPLVFVLPPQVVTIVFRGGLFSVIRAIMTRAVTTYSNTILFTNTPEVAIVIREQ